jgi:MOSC domain-containing protein YiiM
VTRGGDARVVAVARNADHRFSKQCAAAVTLVAGLGIAGDAHFGATVQHRSRVAKDPTQPNLRQVHLIHCELLEELAAQGFTVAAGDLGENILTSGIDLLALPRGARLHIGKAAVLVITGLRNPCRQIDAFQSGLMHAVLDTAPDGSLIRKAGVMAVVEKGGDVVAGDTIRVILPAQPWGKLDPV